MWIDASGRRVHQRASGMILIVLLAETLASSWGLPSRLDVLQLGHHPARSSSRVQAVHRAPPAQSRFLRLRGGGRSGLEASTAGFTSERRNADVVELLPHRDVVKRTALGVCATVEQALDAARGECRSYPGAVPPLSARSIAALRATQTFLRALGGQRALEGREECAWLKRVACGIIELMQAYMGSANDLASEILLFDTLRSVLRALDGLSQQTEEVVGGQDEAGMDRSDGAKAGVNGTSTEPSVVVPWRRLMQRFVLLHVPLLSEALRGGSFFEPETVSWRGTASWVGAAAALRHQHSLLALVRASHGWLGDGGQGRGNEWDGDRAMGFYEADAAESMWNLLRAAASERRVLFAREVSKAALLLLALFMPPTLFNSPHVVGEIVEVWERVSEEGGNESAAVDTALCALLVRALAPFRYRYHSRAAAAAAVAAQTPLAQASQALPRDGLLELPAGLQERVVLLVQAALQRGLR
jgi:hypothetical protein